MRLLTLTFAALLLLYGSVVFAQDIDLSSVETLDLVANPPVTVKVDVPDDTLAIWEIVQDFGVPTIERSELLRRSEKFMKDFPQSKHVARAKEIVKILTRMSAEELPRQSQPIERLIFLLRDQHGVQFMQPGSCDILYSDRLSDAIRKSAPELAGKYDPSPAQQLIDIGFDAVPLLIDHIDDDTFTRSVGYHRNFYFSHHVLRVSDCVETVLHEIAPTGRVFEIGDDPALTKRAMKAHYAHIIEQIKAEKKQNQSINAE